MSSPCFGKPHSTFRHASVDLNVGIGTTYPNNENIFSVKVLLDVSNHGVLFLPMQRIAYRPLNSSEFINIVVGPSNLKSFTDGPEQQQKWKARDAGDADIDEKQNERDGTFCAASIMDMEPIPFTTAMPLDQTPYNGSMFGVPCVASNSSPVSLGEKMQNVRRCSLSSLFSMYNAETDSFDCFCSREKSAASHPLEFQNKEQYQPCQQSGEDAALSTTLDGIKICKPLSCYNYFYRDERDNIVNGIGNPGDPLPEPVHDFSDAKRSLLLKHHWYDLFSF